MNRSDKFYTIEEATDILGISEHEIMNMITLQKLHAVQIEKTIRIREEDMEKFLDSLGRADDATVDNTKDETGMAAEMKRIDGEDDEIRNEYKAGNELEENKIHLEKLYKELLRKKQELEEDINYLQYKYDEFKSRIKRIISEEFKLFLKKIDEENLQEGDGVTENNFDNDTEIGGDINNTEEDEENEEDDFDTNSGTSLIEDNRRNETNLISGKDNTIEFKGRETDNI
ncbi:MAG: helix-turn-helix domain-containing protein [Elusimicrobia bacterium]|nr:helix-turn-helix domain-containing protein [Elusimicrobiota bacterium]